MSPGGWRSGPPGWALPVSWAWAPIVWPGGAGLFLALLEVAFLQLWVCFCESGFRASRLTVRHLASLHLLRRPPPEPSLASRITDPLELCVLAPPVARRVGGWVPWGLNPIPSSSFPKRLLRQVGTVDGVVLPGGSQLPRELVVAANHVLRNVRVDEPRFLGQNLQNISWDTPGGRSAVVVVPDLGGRGAPFVLTVSRG